jgi:hypothetical protein
MWWCQKNQMHMEGILYWILFSFSWFNEKTASSFHLDLTFQPWPSLGSAATCGLRDRCTYPLSNLQVVFGNS